MNLYGILLIFEKNVLMKHVLYFFMMFIYQLIKINICLRYVYAIHMKAIFQQCLKTLSIVLEKKYVSENAGTSKSFFLPLSNCVNTEINAQLPKNKLSLVDVV